MKIGVISDTHLSEPTEALFNLTSGLFADVSMIFHAGDLTHITVLDAFCGKDVIAVRGNMDASTSLPITQVVKVLGFSIGLVHGWGTYHGIENRIINIFSNVDAIVYGHTHEPVNYRKNGILMFNPGSFSGSRSMPRFQSVGILTIGEWINGEIVRLGNEYSI